MIIHLHIKNFTIIDELHLDINTGLSVITGETGAGKSIIIDALQLALGGRANTNTLRHDAERCEINVTLALDKLPQARQWLKEEDIECEDNQCVLRRIIKKEGPSRSSINGTPCSLQQIRAFAPLLINIYSQHAHHALLHKHHQRERLDACGNHQQLVEKVAQLYQQWHQCKQALEALRKRADQGDAHIELLRYQLQELEELDLQDNEANQLHQELTRLSQAESLITHCNNCEQMLAGEQDHSLMNTLTRCLSELNPVFEQNTQLKNAYDCLQQALIHCQEAQTELTTCLTQIDLNPQRLQEIETRLEHIHDIARKHHIAIEALEELKTKLTQEYQAFEEIDQQIEMLGEQLEGFSKAYQQSATQLTQARQRIATILSQQITHKIQQLGMPHAKFDVKLQPLPDFSANGLEQVEFMVMTNPGQGLQPLAKVASGGELSRIGLAVQVFTAQQSDNTTLVFDEVDVGIGGGTAEIVGQLLRDIAEHNQTLCITHQPQVAAQGHQHLQVRKHTEKNTSYTQVIQLDQQARVQELARMLGGVNITQKTTAHAEEMLLLDG